MANLVGKVALITGGSSGIGRATAVAFAREGAIVVVASRRNIEGEETVRLIKEAGGEGCFIRTDVSQEADVKAMVEQTIATYDRLDFAFNNAGVEQDATPLMEQSSDDYDRIMAINVKGVWLCMKYEIAPMLKQGSGAIVNMSSLAGVVGVPQVPIYTASKHAVLGLTKAVALEYAKSGIRVNAVCPGAIDTEMFERFAGDRQDIREHIMAMHPMGRIAQPEEIARAVVWLCSDGASFITGHPLMLDGGFVAA